jgi:hypothetical protein
MRSIAKGSDGWYFENVKIEPTEEEIAAWEAIWCRHCSMGSIMDRRPTISTVEACATQVPCPACFGTGRKDFGNYFQYFSNAKQLTCSGLMRNPDTLSVYRRMSVEFDMNYPVQQDGRPLNPHYERHLKILHIGRAVLEALEGKQNA